MPHCEGCKNYYSDVEPHCPYCGRYKSEDPEKTKEVDIIENRTLYDCPLCNNSYQTQKVTAILSAGTSKTTAESDTSEKFNLINKNIDSPSGQGYLPSKSKSYQIHLSKLAELIRPPEPPEKPPSKELPDFLLYLIGALVCIPTCLIGKFLNLSFDGFWEGVGSLLIMLVIFILFMVLIIIGLTSNSDKKRNQTYQQELISYQKAKSVWEKLYYCHQHDIVFMSGHEEYAPVNKTWKACIKWGETQNTNSGM